MKVDMNALIEAAKHVTMTPEEKEEQRRSFAYGNAAIENERVTRELIDVQADIMAQANTASSTVS